MFFGYNGEDTSLISIYNRNKKRRGRSKYLSRMVESKQDYDEQYDNLTRKTHLLSSYNPGSIFKISGREYVLTENHTLDIPHGEDIYAMEYPAN